MYRSDHPKLAPVADPQARALLANLSAPAIAANTPLDKSNLRAAIMEEMGRESLFRMATVTSGELPVSNKRTFSSMCEHVAHEDPAAPVPADVAPPWFTATMGDVNWRLGAMNDAMDERFRELRNDSKKSRNALIVIRAEAEPTLLEVPLSHYIRVNAAIGPGHPGEPHVDQAELPDVPVGAEFPSPPFPRTLNELQSMTPEQIQMFSMLMNDDFGIEAGDGIGVRRGKLRTALLFGM